MLNQGNEKISMTRFLTVLGGGGRKKRMSVRGWGEPPL